MAKLKMTGKEVLNMVKDYYRYKYISGQSREVKVMKITEMVQGEKFLRSVNNPNIIFCGILIHVPDIIYKTSDEIIKEHYIVQNLAFDETKREIVGEFWVETVKKEDLNMY